MLTILKNICTLFALILFGWSLPYSSYATKYYVHPEIGDDQHPGTTLLKPFKSLERASRISLQGGDIIYLAAGHTFKGQLSLKDAHGTIDQPILVSSHHWGQNPEDGRAIIQIEETVHGVLLIDCSNLIIENLIIKAGDNSPIKASDNMRCGVLVTTSKPGLYENIQLNNLHVHNIFAEVKGFSRGKKEVRTANGTQRYGWGIRFINRTDGAIFKDLLVSNCLIENIAHTGIKFTAKNRSAHQIKVYNNRVLKTGGPGIQMSGIHYGHIKGNYIKNSGSNDDSRKWGRGSGLWTWGSSDIIIEHNHFLNANGPADSAGCHIDFNCENVVVQYNFSANNAGGFCEILGNNYNCAYRYNISVNDGHRVKGQNGAFQEGKTFWLSGFQGKNRKRKGPFNSYFYNNTIYVGKAIVSKVAVSKVAEGVLIANNIFYIEGSSQAVKGDQYVPEKEGVAQVLRIFFANNLFLKRENWPDEVWIREDQPLIGEPSFTQKGGLQIIDYIPLNTTLIKDQGIDIPYLPEDPIGLFIGLRPQFDILGNPIKKKPDLGAIEIE